MPDADPQGPLDPRSEAVLATLLPPVRNRFRLFLRQAQAIAAKRGLRYIAIQGTRGWDEQKKLYAQGRTAPGKIVTRAKPGSSWHNFGVAIDCGVFNASGAYLDETQEALANLVHEMMADTAIAFGLEPGSRWTTFRDTPHYQFRPGGMTLSDANELHAQGKPVL